MAHAAMVQMPTLAKPATLAAKMEMNPSTLRPHGRDAHVPSGCVLCAVIRVVRRGQICALAGDNCYYIETFKFG
jgi:hypothetical protein